MTFARLVNDNLIRSTHRVALRCAGTETSFGELDEQMRFWARFLHQLEISAGARVAMLLPPSRDFTIVHAGNLLTGRISVPLNTRAPAVELAAILADCEPELVIAEDALLDELRPLLAKRELEPHLLQRRLLRSSLSAGARSPEAPAPEIDANDAALIVYTSGTTGRPKGVVHTQASLRAGIESLGAVWEFVPDDHVLIALPLFHVHGLGNALHGTLALGQTITMLERFDPEEVLSLLQDEDLGIDVFHGVPTMYRRLLDLVEAPVKLGLRLAACGSAPLPAEMHRALREKLGLDVVERYGMTETQMLCSNPLHGERRAGRVGPPLPGVELRIVGDGDDDESEGEIRVRGPALFREYWNSPELTAAAFDEESWLETGDLGHQDPADGSVAISGRKKELIISGGFNVHPREVEEALLAIEGVEECAVAGLPDDDLGEIVAAWIVGAPGIIERLPPLVADRLSGYKRPRRFFAVDALPRNALGKLERHRLR